MNPIREGKRRGGHARSAACAGPIALALPALLALLTLSLGQLACGDSIAARNTGKNAPYHRIKYR